MTEDEKLTLAEANRKFAILTNNRAWEILDLETMTPEHEEELILTGQASLYHWLGEQKPANIQRAYWLLAHIYTVLEQIEPARKYAGICKDWTDRYPTEMKDFDHAYALEALARVEALSGNTVQARGYYQSAHRAGGLIADHEDRKIFNRDFSGGNWYGLT